CDHADRGTTVAFESLDFDDAHALRGRLLAKCPQQSGKVVQLDSEIRRPPKTLRPNDVAVRAQPGRLAIFIALEFEIGTLEREPIERRIRFHSRTSWPRRLSGGFETESNSNLVKGGITRLNEA